MCGLGGIANAGQQRSEFGVRAGHGREGLELAQRGSARVDHFGQSTVIGRGVCVAGMEVPAEHHMVPVEGGGEHSAVVGHGAQHRVECVANMGGALDPSAELIIERNPVSLRDGDVVEAQLACMWRAPMWSARARERPSC